MSIAVLRASSQSLRDPRITVRGSSSVCVMEDRAASGVDQMFVFITSVTLSGYKFEIFNREVTRRDRFVLLFYMA